MLCRGPWHHNSHYTPLCNHSPGSCDSVYMFPAKMIMCFVFPSVLYVENSKKKRVNSNARLSISIVHILLKYSSFGTTLFKPTNLKVQEMQNGQLNPHVRSPGSAYDPWLPGPYFIFVITKKCYIWNISEKSKLPCKYLGPSIQSATSERWSA